MLMPSSPSAPPDWLNCTTLSRTELRRGDLDHPIAAVLTLRDDFANRVDLLVGLRGFDQQALSRTLEVAFEGESLKFVGLEDFVAMRIFAGAPKDLADARNALKAADEAPDEGLLRDLAKRYGVSIARSLDELWVEYTKGLDSGLEFE